MLEIASSHNFRVKTDKKKKKKKNGKTGKGKILLPQNITYYVKSRIKLIQK